MRACANRLSAGDNQRVLGGYVGGLYFNPTQNCQQDARNLGVPT
jgi:hypothetical protein